MKRFLHSPGCSALGSYRAYIVPSCKSDGHTLDLVPNRQRKYTQRSCSIYKSTDYNEGQMPKRLFSSITICHNLRNRKKLSGNTRAFGSSSSTTHTVQVWSRKNSMSLFASTILCAIPITILYTGCWWDTILPLLFSKC